MFKGLQQASDDVPAVLRVADHEKPVERVARVHRLRVKEERAAVEDQGVEDVGPLSSSVQVSFRSRPLLPIEAVSQPRRRSRQPSAVYLSNAFVFMASPYGLNGLRKMS